MPFARFMEIALYDPEAGYYGSGRATIGRGGDFYTNVSVGPLFGWLLAAQFEQMWELLGRPAPFHVIEQGAHDGRLAADILSVAGGAFAGALRYVIVEPSDALRALQEKTLEGKNVRHARTLGELGEVQGVVFGNELIDAFPFHLVRSTGTGWDELFVVEAGEGFEFVGGPLSAEAASEATHLPQRDAGFLAEVRPAAESWLREVSGVLKQGYVLLPDYGDESGLLFSPVKTRGTFACYKDHRRDDLVLEFPGEKDITSHVDFTALTRLAADAGFAQAGYTDQHHFIVALAEPMLKAIEGQPPPKFLRQLQTLMHPQIMGRAFKFLALAKDAPAELTGFRHGGKI